MMGEVVHFAGADGGGRDEALVTVGAPGAGGLAVDFTVEPFAEAFAMVVGALAAERRVDRMAAFLRRAAKGIEHLGYLRVSHAPDGTARIILEPHADLLALVQPAGGDNGGGAA